MKLNKSVKVQLFEALDAAHQTLSSRVKVAENRQKKSWRIEKKISEVKTLSNLT